MNSVGPILISLGWDPAWDPFVEAAPNREFPGRVTRAGRLLVVQLERGELLATCPDHLHERPVCGDWVMAEVYDALGGDECRGRVSQILPRHNAITRRAVGFERPQALVANVDDIWLVCGLDRSQGLRSLPRYQALCRLESVTVTVVLNKVDLAEDLTGDVALAQAKAPGLDIVTIAALHQRGIENLRPKLRANHTLALLGPSGAGKSTLINALTTSQEQRTREVRRHDQRGCHTTSASQLVRTLAGALVIDSPGLRELGLWQTAGMDHSYADILDLAQNCRFRDCQHAGEPGCYVRGAIEQGLLPSERLLEYLELSRECAARAKLVKGRKRRYR